MALPTRRKNVILLHTDQQRGDSLGCTGNPFARTPNLDRLAADGTVFTRHAACNPICMPSRASLLTGIYPPGHNVWCNGVPLNRREYVVADDSRGRQACDNPAGFVPEPTTMADLFAAAGYDTACFGKLHLTPYLAPKEYGFQESFASWDAGAFDGWNGPYYGFRHAELVLGHGPQTCLRGHYGVWMRENHPGLVEEVRSGRHRGPEGLPDLFPSPVPAEAHYSAWLADRLRAWIGKGRAAPFFAFAGFPDPHHPFAPSCDIAPEFEDIEILPPVDPDGAGVRGSPFEPLAQLRIAGMDPELLRRAVRYTYALVHQLDRAVGAILAALEAAGLADDTIVAFTSDHGDFLGDHGCLRKAFAASDSLLRVPLIIRAPGSSLPGRVTPPVSACDVMPTLATLAGVAVPPGLHGTDLVPLLAAGKARAAFAFSYNGDPRSTNITMYDERFRMTWYPGADFVELFDHDADPGETRNIAGGPQHRAYVTSAKDLMARRLAAWHNPIQCRSCAW